MTTTSTAIDGAVFTIGYEGREVDDFIARLKRHRVKTLVDVRELPLSRRKGYSKTALRELLGENRIDYCHIRELGSPRELRHAARETGDLRTFFRRFQRYLAGQTDAIDRLVEIVATTRACLLCFEADHKSCHRDLVAARIADLTGATIMHL